MGTPIQPVKPTKRPITVVKPRASPPGNALSYASHVLKAGLTHHRDGDKPPSNQ